MISTSISSFSEFKMVYVGAYHGFNMIHRKVVAEPLDYKVVIKFLFVTGQSEAGKTFVFLKFSLSNAKHFYSYLNLKTSTFRER